MAGFWLAFYPEITKRNANAHSTAIEKWHPWQTYTIQVFVNICNYSYFEQKLKCDEPISKAWKVKINLTVRLVTNGDSSTSIASAD